MTDESAAQREFSSAFPHCFEQAPDIVDAMLAVGIERHKRLGALLESVLYARLQSRALSQIYRMDHKIGTRIRRQARCLVVGSIVYDDNPIACPSQLRDDRPDRCRLVVSRAYDPVGWYRRCHLARPPFTKKAPTPTAT